MRKVRYLISALLLSVCTSSLLAQGTSDLAPNGSQPLSDARQYAINIACDAVASRPGSPSNNEQAIVIGRLTGFLGPRFSAPGMAVTPSSPEDLDVAKSIFDRWSNLSCVLSDGKPRLQLFEEAVVEAFGLGLMKQIRPVPQDIAQRQLDAIRRRYPGSPFATLVEAHYLNAMAWDARGGGYNNTVTPEGERLFEQSIAKEIELLQANSSIGLTNPDYYNALIAAEGSAAGYSPALVQTFKEAASKYKFYSQFYFETLRFTQEKWGGSTTAMDELIRWSADNTRAQTGDWMYARLYGYVAEFLMADENLFSATEASWPLVRKGYAEHIVQETRPDYPSLGISSNMEGVELNLLVRFACEAKDKKTFLSYRPKLEAHPLPSEWNGPLTLPVCDEKFRYRAAKS